MEVNIGVWSALLIGAVPLLGLLLWHWNELLYALPQKIRCLGTGTKLPPGHMGLPFLGETLSFLWYFKIVGRPDDYIKAKRQKYGSEVGLFRTHLMGSPAIITSSPSASKFVFQSSSTFILYWPTSQVVGANAIGSTQGEEHKRMKFFILRAINNPDALRRIAIFVQPAMIDALESWARKGRILGYTEVRKVTFQNIGKFFASFEPGPIMDSLSGFLEGLLKGVRANPINLPGTTYYKALQCRRKAVEIFREELVRRKRNVHEAVDRDDLMDMLMQLKDEQGKQLRDVEVIDNMVSFIVAGYESTSTTTAWALYFLAKYPGVLQRLREENMTISKKSGHPIAIDDILGLKYTEKVVEETIRLTNIAPFISRIATKDVEYEGYRIPKGWNVIQWVRYLHMDPDNFSDPQCFNPDRWNEPTKPGTYFAFGGGTRLCPGNMFARLQIALFLHHLAVGYKWELANPNSEISYLPYPKPVDGVEIAFSKLGAAK